MIVVVSVVGEIQTQWFDKECLSERDALDVCIVGVVGKVWKGMCNKRGVVDLWLL